MLLLLFENYLLSKSWLHHGTTDHRAHHVTQAVTVVACHVVAAEPSVSATVVARDPLFPDEAVVAKAAAEAFPRKLGLLDDRLLHAAEPVILLDHHRLLRKLFVSHI